MGVPSLTVKIVSPCGFTIGLDYQKEIYSLVACFSPDVLGYYGLHLLHDRNFELV